MMYVIPNSFVTMAQMPHVMLSRQIREAWGPGGEGTA